VNARDLELKDDQITFENVVEVASVLIGIGWDFKLPVLDHVRAELAPREREALLSVYRLAGPQGVLDWLDERFRGDEPMLRGNDEALAPQRGFFVPFRFVRIRPNVRREIQVIGGIQFRKDVGWYKTTRPIAALCAAEPLNDRNLADGSVFEVATTIPRSTRFAEVG
jgi:hypothetical protein